MARGINKVIIVGNAGNDPETRYMPSGAAVTNVSIATSESWKDKQTGQMQERTEWHRVTLMDRGNYRLGQIAGEFIKKGSKVYVEGSLRTREWEKDGIKRYTTEVIASELQLLDSRQDGQQGNQGQGGYSGQQQGSNQPQQGYGQAPQQGGYSQNQQPQPNGVHGQPQSYGSWGNQPNNTQGGAQPHAALQQRASQQPAPNFDDFDDDIPF